MTPVSGLASNATLGLTNLAITTGFHDFYKSLADTFRALELTKFKRYTTVSPARY